VGSPLCLLETAPSLIVSRIASFTHTFGLRPKRIPLMHGQELFTTITKRYIVVAVFSKLMALVAVVYAIELFNF
jgi:hypothetical protein